MTIKFTNNNLVSNAIMTMALVFVSMGVYAQNLNTLTINAPAEIAGDYNFVMSAFGNQATADINGDGVLLDDGTDPVNDSCEPGATNVLGKIAFLDRGGCEFGTKVLNAENAGAMAVIICTNDDEPPFSAGPGADGDNVNITSGMISRQDCETIRVAFANGDIDVTIAFKCVPPVYGPEVIWGRNTGEGDFNGSLNDWTVEKPDNVVPATWHWNPNGAAVGQFTNFQIDSPTQCNGAAVMNSDSLDNGQTGNIGSGPCPGPCTASLVSPVIDLSGADATKGFFIQFTQAFRQFTSNYNIIVDKNNTGTWLDTIPMNTDAVVNSPNINENVKIPLQGYAGVQSIQFKFEYVANYYYWVIDDVSITNESYVDMQVNANWYAAAPQWRTPVHQVSEMPFLIDIFNNGNLDAQNVQVAVNIYDDTNTMIYEQVKDYGVIDAYTLNENNVFEGGSFTPPAQVGTYTGYYVVTAESPDPAFTNNQVTSNDSIEFNLEVTENTFALAPGMADGNTTMRPITDGSIFANGASSENIANGAGMVFYTPNGAGHDAISVTFGVTDEEQQQSGFVHALLYQWLGDLGGISEDDMVNPNERVLVGTKTVIVDTVTNLNLITMDLDAVDGNGNPMPGSKVHLADDAQYFLYLSTEPLTNSPGCCQIDLLSAQNTNGFDRNYNHFASNMAFDSTDVINRSPGTYYIGLTSGTILDAEASSPDFYDINTLWAEVLVELNTGVEDINPDIALAAYPNPAGNQLFVNYTLENASPLSIEIIDLEGKLVQKDKFDAQRSGTVLLNVENINTGMYILNVRTNEGIRTQKIMIQK